MDTKYKVGLFFFVLVVIGLIIFFSVKKEGYDNLLDTNNINTKLIKQKIGSFNPNNMNFNSIKLNVTESNNLNNMIQKVIKPLNISSKNNTFITDFIFTILQPQEYSYTLMLPTNSAKTTIVNNRKLLNSKNKTLTINNKTYILTKDNKIIKIINKSVEKFSRSTSPSYSCLVDYDCPMGMKCCGATFSNDIYDTAGTCGGDCYDPLVGKENLIKYVGGSMITIGSGLIVASGGILFIVGILLVLLGLLAVFLAPYFGKPSKTRKPFDKGVDNVLTEGERYGSKGLSKIIVSSSGLGLVAQFADNEVDNLVVEQTNDGNSHSGVDDKGNAYIKFPGNVKDINGIDLDFVIINLLKLNKFRIIGKGTFKTICDEFPDSKVCSSNYKKLTLDYCKLHPTLPACIKLPELPVQDNNTGLIQVPQISSYCENNKYVIVYSDGTKKELINEYICCKPECKEGKWFKNCGDEGHQQTSENLNIPCTDPIPCFGTRCNQPPSTNNTGGGSGTNTDVPTVCKNC
jgi:hypothetical protein